MLFVENLFLEREQVRQIELEHLHAGGPIEPEGARVEPGREDHDLPAAGCARAQQVVVVETRADRDLCKEGVLERGQLRIVLE